MFKVSLSFIVAFNMAHAGEFDFLEDKKIEQEMKNVGKKLENITDAKKEGVKQDLSVTQCEEIMKKERSYMQKDIYRFVTGTPFTSFDLDGEHVQGPVGDEYGNYAKIGLSKETFFRVNSINSKWAVHADPRCGIYAKVKKVDFITYQGASCRRAHLSLGKLSYKVFFCENNNKGYVDHFNVFK